MKGCISSICLVQRWVFLSSRRNAEPRLISDFIHQGRRNVSPRHVKTAFSRKIRTKTLRANSSHKSRERGLPPLSRLLPTIFNTTSTFGAQRIFSSFPLILQRSSARTATRNQSLLSCTVFITTTRAKSGKRMPPKKAVKEEKILLGRPGNNLKSGIVCSSPIENLQLSNRIRSVLQTLESRHSSKLSPSAPSETLP